MLMMTFANHLDADQTVLYQGGQMVWFDLGLGPNGLQMLYESLH